MSEGSSSSSSNVKEQKKGDGLLEDVLKFLPFQSTTESSFWMKLGDMKLDTIRLKEEPIPLMASYGIVPTISRRVSSLVPNPPKYKFKEDPSLQPPTTTHHGRMRLDQNAFFSDDTSNNHNNNEVVWTNGQIVILNTLESFKTTDKNQLLQTHCLNRLLSICCNNGGDDDDKEDNTNDLVTFFCLTYLDLKHHKVLYWFAFPSLVPAPGKSITTSNAHYDLLSYLWGKDSIYQLEDAYHQLRIQQLSSSSNNSGCPPFFIILRTNAILSSSSPNKDEKKKNKKNSIQCLPLNSKVYHGLTTEEQQSCIFAFLDPVVSRADSFITTNNDNDNDDDDDDGSKPLLSSSLKQRTTKASPVTGWPLRNLIAYLSLKLNLGDQKVNIISYRPGVLRRIDLSAELSHNDNDDNDDDNDDDDNDESYELFIQKTNPRSSHTHVNSSFIISVNIPKKEDYLWPDDKDTTTGGGGGGGRDYYRCMGWELNARSKPGPRSLNLAPLLSPSHLAQQATDLNLKLMKWRMIPKLDLPTLSNLNVLLIGAGTLGCSVARTLLGWGVRHFTFLDNGTVSYSNPVRQSLFELSDCHTTTTNNNNNNSSSATTTGGGGGKDKAVAAAEALKRIAGPSIQSCGHKFTIPMPGHSFLGSKNEEDVARKDVQQLDQLIQNSDVIFLLTDTRESRWLPTVMANAHDKMLINAALGLDSWLVMRHGGGNNNSNNSSNNKDRLGCYFCNDIVAAQNSTKDRTLDQQCTVTRPGIAPIASSMAVELMISLLHHPLKQHAPAPMPTTTKTTTTSGGTNYFSPTVQESDATSPLGIMPHQIRGSVVSYTMMTPTVPAFRYCTGCCDKVIHEYNASGFDFVKKVCCDTMNSYLETMTGLKQYKMEAARKMQDCLDDWDDEEEEDNDIITDP